jgi:hypothetical protein
MSLVDHGLSLLANFIDAVLMAGNLGLECLVLLHQVLHADQITPPIGGGSQRFFLMNPVFFVFYIAEELLELLGIRKLLLTLDLWWLKWIIGVVII